MKAPELQILPAPLYQVLAGELEPGDVIQVGDLLPSPDVVQGWVPVYPMLLGQTVPPNGFGTRIVRP